MLVPITFNSEGTQPKLQLAASEIQEPSLKALSLTEANLEEFIRTHIDYLFSEETLLIVGQQARNKAGGRADLVAVDGNGNIVLIEIKRDKEDIVSRPEPFEFQAIRYAANYARITSAQELVEKLYAPYVERHINEFSLQGLTPSELALRSLSEFLAQNQSEKTFNQRQRIVLIASSFDPQTLSACAWLAKNGIDISCLRLQPLRFQEQYFFQIEQIIPPPALEQFFVELVEAGTSLVKPSSAKSSKATLPKMTALLEWGLIAPGDAIHIRNHENQPASIVDDRFVHFQGQKLRFNHWGQQVTEWGAINIYEWTIHHPTGKSLDQLRRQKLQELEMLSEAPPEGESTDGSPGMG